MVTNEIRKKTWYTLRHLRSDNEMIKKKKKKKKRLEIEMMRNTDFCLGSDFRARV